MNRIFYLVLVAAIITSCQQKKHGAFEVTGTIKNAPGKKLVLMETPFAGGQPVVLDSTFLQEKGAFKLRGRANEEGIYRLMIENGPDVIVINDNNEIKVNLDINDYRSYKIEGSPASESLHKLFEDYRAKDSLILATFKAVDSVKAVAGQDSIAEMLQAKNDQQIADLNNLLKDFVKTSPSAAASIYALGIASQTIPNEEIKVMVDVAAKKFSGHGGLAKIKSILAVKASPAPTTNDAANSYALLNKQAPELTMNDVNGKPVSVTSFKGKYVLIDFWASWCAPCRQENPNVVAAYNQFKNKNFTILGVSLDKDVAAWQKAIQKDNLSWTHMSDLKQWESAAVPAYGFDGIPFNVLVDPSGKIIASALRGEELINKLSEVLK